MAINSVNTSGSAGSGVLSSAGVGSGLDVDSIVTALVNAKKAGPQAQITSKATQTNATLTGLASLSSALSSLQSSLTKLTTTSTFASFGATLADSTIGSTATLASAQPGNYSLVVSNLAAAQKRSSDAYAKTAAIGAGNLTLSVGAKSSTLAIGATDTVADIAAKINGASDNHGVTATVVNGASGAQLLLSSSQTGVANGFSVSTDGGSSSGLAALATKLNTSGANEAKDALISLDGIDITSASNSVSGAIDGVTLNLSAPGSTTLTVTRDTSVASKAVQGFVDAYNSYVKTVGTLSSYDKDSGQAGILLGDTTLGSVQRQISSLLGSKVAGNSIGSLASLGITRSADGTLALDSAKLAATLQSNPSGVQDLFAGPGGYAKRLNSALDSFTASGGIIGTRQQSLTASLSRLNTQQSQLDARLSVYEQQLRDQYAALDTLMSRLNNTSSYLTGALAQLEATYTKKS
ncbi:flagellar filament capping protein FliD [Dyella sp.]|jgi:flagellar hook-associated protein 2|uniref:flagellar filament capping protein FliD n=1 Tax=Dyella sp. TaxID=1869338 RepID=UPI002D78B6BA|nr:flagellar filament capping protein FliD [Dyella sp.]HET6433842.1 flagellar filament capping protein FliD [Dyella sp.]